MEWRGDGLRFSGAGTEPATPSIRIDGGGNDAPSPMLLLLLACASCSGSDVVLILEKMRVKLRDLSIEVEGVRRDSEPRRYTAMRLLYALSGDGLNKEKAERAVSLSLDKYCSVVHSLAPDIDISYEIAVA